MSNLVTVRTDVWGVVGRVQIFDEFEDGPPENGQWDPGEAVTRIVADRRFYLVLDRSHQPIRVIMRRYLPD